MSSGSGSGSGNGGGLSRDFICTIVRNSAG